MWDAATLLELRAGRRILSRAVGMGSIRVSAVQKVIWLGFGVGWGWLGG